jgi:hypothetical protein
MYVSIFSYVETVLTVARTPTVNMLVGQMEEKVTNNKS